MSRFRRPRPSGKRGVRSLLLALLAALSWPAVHAHTPIFGVLPDTTLFLGGTDTNYYLANDIEWSSVSPLAMSPIAIVSNGITLDLNGKTIRATGSSSNAFNSMGIIVSGCSNVVVTNGTIEGFREKGIFVELANTVTLADLTVTKIQNPTTSNITNGNSVAGISVELGSVLISNVVISNVSGGPNVGSVNGLSALGAPGLTVIDSMVTGVSNAPSVGLNDNLCNGVAVLGSPGAGFSNLVVSNVVGNSNTASVAGLLAAYSANFLIGGVTNTVSGITNQGGVAEGISGVNPAGMTVLSTRVSDVYAGEHWLDNLIGHTALGMAFAPIGGFPLGIAGVTVTSGGSGYTSAPAVSVSAVPNDSGSGATARAVVKNGRVVAIKMLTTGSNFMTFPSIVFNGGGGSGAAAIVLPSQVIYDATNTNTGGGVFVTNCTVQSVTGSVDDAHGISFFGVTNVSASNIVVRNVLDGTNSLGIGGSKATGIESYGNPMVDDSSIKLVDCRVENIRANSPGDLAALGFSAAGGGIIFSNCIASNVTVTGVNRLYPRAKPGYGYGFGWAPDVRLNYQYPAWNVRIEDCTATHCDVGFETFNFQDSVWIDPASQKNRIAYLKQRSKPGLPEGTKRILYGSVWNEIYEATNYTKAVPVWNNASGNRMERNGRSRPF